MISKLIHTSAASLLALGLAGAATAAELPGKGITVQPIKSSIAEESFQTLLVSRALEKLGYTVKAPQEIEYATGHLALANGDATFLATHWDPLHADFYKNAGGDAKLVRKGVYSDNAAQGYLIDKKTADQYKITNIGQFADPKIAKLFDTDGDGKADLDGERARRVGIVERNVLEKRRAAAVRVGAHGERQFCQHPGVDV